jgi:hypothetical protein
MAIERDDDLNTIEEAVPEISADYLPGEELQRAVERGEITQAEANERLQAAARRHAAEHGPDLDTDEEGRTTTGGFGAGQGMAQHSSGGRKADQGIEGN